MKKIIILVLLIILAILICSPILFMLGGSIMGNSELSSYLSPVLDNKSGFVHWSLIPNYPTLRSFVALLLDSPEFFVMFWNSIKMTLIILIGQLIISVPAAWGFARLKIPYKNTLFNLYVILMLMPFQVTMLSNYLTLDKLNLMNTQYSIILPAIFSTFPVFIIHRFFCSIPVSIIEASKLDGANKFQVFLMIGIPLGSAGIVSAMILGFLESWNLIEQPLAFLEDKTLWPLSLYLPNIGLELAGIAFAASIVAIVPSLLIFFGGQEHLEAGIAASALKE
ncbi:MAG TPA: carbohydrate ABC transporter permease [Ruminiclostridium sp.]